jgi:hypothetical protein
MPAASPPTTGSVSTLEVNMGHVFALRPRAETSFRPDDLRTAKQRLKDEPFATIEEAARAVAEMALELTHDGPSAGGGGTRRKAHR